MTVETAILTDGHGSALMDSMSNTDTPPIPSDGNEYALETPDGAITDAWDLRLQLENTQWALADADERDPAEWARLRRAARHLIRAERATQARDPEATRRHLAQADAEWPMPQDDDR